jgi:hypothetical protein
MKRPAAALFGCIAILLLLTVAGIASIPTVQTGTWQPMGSMPGARSGATAVLLPDHRVLIAGGDGGSGAVNGADVFNADGSFSGVSAMGTPRSEHVAVVLRDERVLVAGGVTAGGGATNSAEIYDPASDTWTAIAGGMTEARSKATAALLQDGRVLVAGGQNGSTPSATVEIFDPTTGQFSFAGSLSSRRMGLASASLADGRVLITGGSNGNVPVATSDVFDPTTNTVSAGPAMTSPRVGHSATALLDGRVLVAGGNNGSADLASAEIYDAATGGFAVVASSLAAPRRDHAAILLPNNNSVLIVGGTSAGNEVATAETFVPWTGAFAATGSPAVSRQRAAVSGLNQAGLLFMAGGSSAGTPVSSAELYGFATVKTDKADYAPGEVVTIIGSGWQPGETVTLTMVESPLLDTHPVMTAVADGQGRITNTDFTPDEHDFNIRFYLTAVGGQSGFQALNTFTDNGNKSIFSDSNTTSETTAFGSISANQCRSSWLVAMQGNNLATAPVNPPATATLGSMPAGVTFFAGPGCTGSPVTTLSLGTTDVSAQFSFRIAAVGNYTINGTGLWDAGGNHASATVTVGQASSTVTASSATATYGGTVTLSAVLSANGVGVSGKTITFQLNGINAGTATTDATGTATRNNVSLTSPSKINAGTYASGVSASFAGDSSFGASSGTNSLTVNQKAITVTAATNSKTYDATTSAAATPTITSGGPLVTGDTANFAESYDNKNVGTNKTLTPSGTVNDGNSGNNYGYTFATNTTGVITTRNLTVTAATNTKTYDATTSAAATPTITTGALQGTDTANFTEAYANKNAGSNLTLIPSGTVSDGNGGNNYAVTFANNTTGVINKASLTLTAVTNTKTYDATTSAAAIPTSSGLQGSDTVTGLTESYDTKNAGAGKTLSVNAGYTVNDGNTGGNYTVTTQTNTTGVINKASLTPSITADDKDYDTTSAATIHCTLAGVLAADTGNVTCSGTGTFADANAGTKTVTSNDLALSGTASGNYMLSTTTASTTATIRKVNATITVTPYSVTYDGDPHTATGTAKGVGGVDLSANLNLTGTTHTFAGTYADTWTFTGSPNYNDATNTVSDVISKADPVIVANGITVTYDGQPHAGTANATGVKGEALTPVNVAYTVVLAPPRNPGDLLTSAPVNAGNYLVAARFAGDTNYNQKQSAAAAVVINKATPTVSVSFGSSPITYDGNPHPAAATVLGVGGADITSGHGTVTVTYTPGPGAPVNAGSYTASAHFASGDGNYTDADSSAAASLTINKADPVITAAGGTFTYDGNPHGGTATATGVNSEPLTPVNVAYTVVAAPPRNPGDLLTSAPVNAGSYSVAARFAGNINYNPKQSAPAALIISKADAVITLSGYTGVYDGNAHGATGSAHGVENPTAADLSSLLHLGSTFTNVPGGTAHWTFDGNNNYNPASGDVSIVITKATPVVMAAFTPSTITYDGNPHPASYTVTGVNGTDLSSGHGSVAIAYAPGGAIAPVNAGSYTATAQFTSTDGNYTDATSAPASLTINKADPVILAMGGTFAYDGNAHGGTASATGVNNEPLAPVSVAYTVVAAPPRAPGDLLTSAPLNAGSYLVAARFAGNANYNPKQSAAAALIISKADAVITVTGYTGVYDGNPHGATGTAHGVESPTPADLSGLLHLGSTFTNVPGGTAHWTFDGSNNYNAASGDATITVTQADAMITVNGYSNVYDGNPHAATGSAKGVKGEDLSSLLNLGASFTDVPGGTAHWTFAGNNDYKATAGDASITIAPAGSLTTVTCPAGLSYNGMPQMPCAASVTGVGGLNQPLQVVYANNVIVGTATATAAYAGDNNHTGGNATAYFMITPAPTSTSLITSPNPSNWGDVVTLTATVSNTINQAVPTGSVDFYAAASGAACNSLGTSTLINTVPLNGMAPDTATTSTPSLAVGTDTILACFNNNGTEPNFVASSGLTSQTVNPAPIVTLTPTSLSFGNQQAGTTSGAQSVTVCNGPSVAPGCSNAPISTAAVLIDSIAFTNANTTSPYFTQTNNCPISPSTLSVGTSCVIYVKFAPPANTSGTASALITLTDNNRNVSGSMQSASVTGSGTSSISGVGSLSTYALFATANGCSSVSVSGNGTVDSYNGPSNNGNIGTNGNASLNGNPVVNGAIYSPVAGMGNCNSKGMTGLSTSGKASATGGLQPLPGPINYPLPPAPSPAPPTTAQSISGTCGTVSGCTPTGSKSVSLVPGGYGNLSATGGTTLHLRAGTYNFNSLTLSGNSILYVDSGPVIINLAGASLNANGPAVDLSGGSIVNPTAITSNLQIYYAGSNAVKVSGGTASYAIVYVPNAPVNLSGGAHFYGSIVGNTINSSGNTAVHYDATQTAIQAGQFIWFNSSGLNVQGLPNSGSVKLYVTNGMITFSANGSLYKLAVPNAVITFSSTVSSASTTWDAANNRWSTLIPLSKVKANATIHSFFDGLAYQAPTTLPGGIQNVTWQAAYSTSTPGISFNWQWGAAVYNQFPAYSTGDAFPPLTTGDYNQAQINALDNSDPAGTPESQKANLVFGDMGAGYTGLYAGTTAVVPTIAPLSFSQSSLDFGPLPQGSSSPQLTTILTNNDSIPYTISGISVTGTYAGDFTLTNNCPISPNNLAAGGTCTFTVTLTPSAGSGTKETAKIVVNDNANNSPQTVFLKGTVQ